MAASSSSSEEKCSLESKEEEEEEEEQELKWRNHYCSAHEILCVGDGDFSFSLSLAKAFRSASNIVATSLDSYDTLLEKYKKAKSNLENLKALGATILHEIDATHMKLHTDLKMRKFDRIVFNFPHAGFCGKEDDLRVIRLHRKLVSGFFRNASHMLRPYGEIHVSHKIGGPFDKWNLGELASNKSLILSECANFNIKAYPGYNNKRGDGGFSDDPFPLRECRTFKFIHKKKKAKEVMMPSFGFRRPFGEKMIPIPNHFESFARTMIPNPNHFGSFMKPLQHIPDHFESFTETMIPNSNHFESFMKTVIPNPIRFEGFRVTMNSNPNYFERLASSLHYAPRDSGAYFREPGGYFSKQFENPLRNSYSLCTNEAQRNDLVGYFNHLEEVRSRSESRMHWLRYFLLKHGRDEEAIHFR